MNTKNEFTEIIKRIDNFFCDKVAVEKYKLPSNAFFLSPDEIICLPRNFGDSRYPYSCDGLTLWAFASGNVKVEESTFNIILGAANGMEPHLCFFFGEKKGKAFQPVSITGAGKSYEDKAERFTVFTPICVYYITRTKKLTGIVKMSVDSKKNIQFNVYLKNHSDYLVESYISTFINCILLHTACESLEHKWFKYCKKTVEGYAIGVTENLGRRMRIKHRVNIKREYSGIVHSTTSISDYKGATTNQISNSVPLRTGKFEKECEYTEFSDFAVAGEILPLDIKAGDEISVCYTLNVSNNSSDKKVDFPDINTVGTTIPAISFSGKWGNISGELLTYFVKNVARQNEFCARAKNYAGPLIGVRDIFQQLESALVWIPDYCRKKIVEALGYLGDNGRAPRQFSYSQSKNILPAMDLREYVDQGVWIISTVYTYLAYTGDFSILEEVCGYYSFENNKVGFSDKTDTVLEHLLKIADYLISNFDVDTGCMHILYGDWNDAVDGLGESIENPEKFGSGVSVMATLQFYKNLRELCEILQKTNRNIHKVSLFNEYRNIIRNGLCKHAIVENESGERKIVHGWGDKISHKVACYNDYDGENRYGLTASAFWVLCGALEWDETIKKDILSSFAHLDSKYGLKTFEPYFSLANDKVGRIIDLPKGTAENGATYIHATLFGIQSLFEMNESYLAWQQLYKILPITHSFISTSPFVMSNSYIHNEEKNLDGESMDDWFTGSGCVLIKTLIGGVFGVKPNLDAVIIKPSAFMPFQSAELNIKIKGGELCMIYTNNNTGKRNIVINGTIAGDKKSFIIDNKELLGKKINIYIND